MSRWIRPKGIWGEEYWRGWEEYQGKINSRRPVVTFPFLRTLPLWEVCELVHVCLSDILTHRHTFTNSLSSALVIHTCSLAPEETDGEGWSSAEEAAVTTVSTAGSNTAAYANTSQPHNTQCHVSVENMWNGGGVMEPVCANSCGEIVAMRKIMPLLCVRVESIHPSIHSILFYRIHSSNSTFHIHPILLYIHPFCYTLLQSMKKVA